MLTASPVQRALEHVTHPSLIPDFADEILITFAKHCPPGDHSLPLSYYHTVQPILKSQEAIELLFDAMAQTSVTEALIYSRSHPESAREQLLQRLIASVLDSKPSEETANRASELVSLPLQPVEEEWFEDFLSQGSGKKLKHSKDTLLMRKLATGRYSEAMQEKSTGTRWAVVLEGLRGGLGGRTE